MIIKKLSLKNFRNYETLDVNFNEKINIIIGNNAQGKTNILEAIYYLAITKSFLSISDKNVIMKNRENLLINGSIKNNYKEDKLKITINKLDKKLFINNKEIKRHSDFIGNLKTIFFNPDNLRIIKEGPNNRRKFLNIEISQLYDKYIIILNEFNVILKQRNEYLKYIKLGKYNKEYFQVLNDKFIDLSIYIYEYRDKFIKMINDYIEDIYYEISGFRGLKLKYKTNVDIDNYDLIKTNMLDKLNKYFDNEVINGSTLIGPHRDDFEFIIDDNELLLYGSQGQLKMAVLALKLAEISVFKKVSGEYPVLLLDDLFSELDILKRERIIKYLDGEVQVIITTTDLNNIDEKIINNSFVFLIESGKVVSVSS